MTNRLFSNTLVLATVMGLLLAKCATDDRPGANMESTNSDEKSKQKSSAESSDKSEKESDDDDSDSGDQETEETPDYIIEEDFEVYDADSPVADQAGDPWTTWTHTPGDASDPVISNKEANGGDNAMLVATNNDLVAQLGLLDKGEYKIRFQMLIEEDKLGYFNVLQVFWSKKDADSGVDPGTICKWGADVFFMPGGDGIIQAAGETSAFEFEHGKWLQIQVTIDIDEDIARFSVNDKEITNWEWSSGTQGGDNSPTLGGVNFYGPAMQADGSAVESSYFVDDFSVEEIKSSDDDKEDED